MITAFAPDNLKTLRTEIDAALKAVADKHGIVLKLGSAKYSADNFTAKLEGSVMRGGEVVTREVTEFRRFAHMYGLAPEDLGREFVIRSEVFKITGLATNRPKRPITATSRGKNFVFAAEAVTRALGKEVK